MEFRLVSRRLLLIGTPVLLALLMIVHQLIDQFERPVTFLALHLLLLPLFALMGVAIWVLLDHGHLLAPDGGDGGRRRGRPGRSFRLDRPRAARDLHYP
jgi:hypothetical protein